MYNGIDAFGVDKQPVRNHNPWMLLYFISFLLIVAFFVLNMFVGVVVENFHRCRQEHEAEMQRKKMVRKYHICTQKHFILGTSLEKRATSQSRVAKSTTTSSAN